MTFELCCTRSANLKHVFPFRQADKCIYSYVFWTKASNVFLLVATRAFPCTLQFALQFVRLQKIICGFNNEQVSTYYRFEYLSVWNVQIVSAVI